MKSTLLRENITLQTWTTFKVGGPARWFAEPSTLLEIQELQQWAKSQNIPTFMLGKGSNLVVSDRGFPGLVIHLGKNFSELSIHHNHLKTQAGCLLHTAVTKSVENGLAGIENLAGIPGTMGGGAFINAGAFDQELGQVITKVTTLNAQGQIMIRSNEQCAFSYRHTAFCELDEWIVEVELELKTEDPEVLKTRMTEILKKRRDKQPTELPNAGSMFKRPPGLYAGALIESSGLKGLQVGGAQVSPKHANFVVNVQDAKAQDIWNLTEEVIRRVHLDHGVILQREVIFLGDFS